MREMEEMEEMERNLKGGGTKRCANLTNAF